MGRNKGPGKGGLGKKVPAEPQPKTLPLFVPRGCGVMPIQVVGYTINRLMVYTTNL